MVGDAAIELVELDAGAHQIAIRKNSGVPGWQLFRLNALELDWDRKALAFMKSSSQPAARKWEASLHNNTGYALHLLGRYEDALGEFKLALAARERDGKAQDIRIAYWMIAWTLRALSRLDEALAIQLRLERECDEAGEPDPYVFEELELLYKALNNDEKAEFYAARRKAAA